MGVCPAGAQVRRRVGMSRKPLSSRQARWAPSRRAFFYRWPCIALPVRHGLFVAWEGPAFGHLTAPAQAAQELPNMGGVIAHPKVDLNDRGDAFQGPEVVGEAMGGGSLQ